LSLRDRLVVFKKSIIVFLDNFYFFCLFKKNWISYNFWKIPEKFFVEVAIFSYYRSLLVYLTMVGIWDRESVECSCNRIHRTVLYDSLSHGMRGLEEGSNTLEPFALDFGLAFAWVFCLTVGGSVCA
jgi:hypothetical protein